MQSDTGTVAVGPPAAPAHSGPPDRGLAMHAFIEALYPLCRSITGEGLRSTLQMIGDRIPLRIHEVPSGTRVFDWTVPKEWNIRDAYIRNARGERVVDFARSNLHVVGYSVPVRARMSLAELRAHLYTIPEHPDWVPYRTSYFKETWGFCLSENQARALGEGMYDVAIDATLEDGSLSYGELCIPGTSQDEVLVSCHVCHPSLCNDNLSGIAVATSLALAVLAQPRRYSYRFLFLPATIGAITWLALNEELLSRIRHGLVLACVGDAGHATYKRSRRGNAEIDRAVACALRDAGARYELEEFVPFGYDERQYCSPAFDLPVGCLMRTPHGRYPEYHTSADDPAFVRPEALAASLDTCLDTFTILEKNRRYLNTHPRCEPQLGRRGLYRAVADQKDGGLVEKALLWVLNLSDGRHTLLDVAERSGVAFATIAGAAEVLAAHGLLVETPAGGG